MNYYYKSINSKEKKKLLETENNKIVNYYIKKKKDQNKLLKNFDYRIKNFNREYSVIKKKIDNQIKINKEALTDKLIKKKNLTQKEVLKRVECGIYSANNINVIKDSLLKNDLLNYINNKNSSENKKAYFKSIKQIHLNDYFLIKHDNKNNSLKIKDNQFLSMLKVKYLKNDINTCNFKNPNLFNKINLERNINSYLFSDKFYCNSNKIKDNNDNNDRFKKVNFN